jgi:TRAP-type transport system small permease protein
MMTQQRPRRRPAAVALFDATLNWLAMALIAGLLAVVTAGIVSRAVSRPFSWTDELSGVLMVWLAGIGWMIATRRGVHIRINVFQDKLPTRIWRVTEVAIQLAVALVGAVVAWRSIGVIVTNWDVEAISLPISTAWLYVPLLPAGIVTVLQALVDLTRATPAAPDTEVPML